MVNLPNELLKVQLEISKTTNIYSILESFNYRFSKEEMNKKWLIVGGPKETTNLMEQRKKTLDKDQVKFLDQMKNQQEEFKATIDNLERTIQNFHQHQKLENHNDIAQDVASVNEQLARYQDDARKFNMQESLFEMTTQTDYNKLNTMVKDFQPYSNMWLAANRWFTDYPKVRDFPFLTPVAQRQLQRPGRQRGREVRGGLAQDAHGRAALLQGPRHRPHVQDHRHHQAAARPVPAQGAADGRAQVLHSDS